MAASHAESPVQRPHGPASRGTRACLPKRAKISIASLAFAAPMAARAQNPRQARGFSQKNAAALFQENHHGPQESRAQKGTGSPPPSPRRAPEAAHPRSAESQEGLVREKRIGRGQAPRRPHPGMFLRQSRNIESAVCPKRQILSLLGQTPGRQCGPPLRKPPA